MLSKLRSWLKQKTAEKNYANVKCLNCETVFDGNYCPQCGQAVRDYDKPFSFLFYNFLGDFFAFDTRFFRTFKALLLKPGFLTKEYFQGRRVRYAPPFRVFIFVSFLLFLLLQIYTNRGLTYVLDSSIEESGIVLDSSSISAIDSILAETNKIAIQDSSEDLSMKINLETFKDTRNLRNILNILAERFEANLRTETDPEKKAKLREYIHLCRSPEQATAKMLEYMSWAFFLLLPLFALILKLFYIRRKHNFMRHLIFSIHLHSFIFILFTIVILFHMAMNSNFFIVNIFFLISFLTYSIVAIKNFYGQGTAKVILKFFGVFFIYNIIFWIAVGYSFLGAIGLF